MRLSDIWLLTVELIGLIGTIIIFIFYSFKIKIPFFIRMIIMGIVLLTYIYPITISVT